MPESFRRLSTVFREVLTSVMIHLLGWGVSEAAPRALEAKLDGDNLGLGAQLQRQRELV